MEDVLKMNYQDLYYFKKTLKETNQPLLAKAVIVRLEDGTELTYDNV